MKEIMTSCDKCSSGLSCSFEVRIENTAYDLCSGQCVNKLVSNELEKLNGKLLIIAIRKV